MSFQRKHSRKIIKKIIFCEKCNFKDILIVRRVVQTKLPTYYNTQLKKFFILDFTNATLQKKSPFC